MNAPRRIILDTDPGIDDALAILLALASPEVELLGLSVVHGNCTLAEAVANGLAVLELGGGQHIPLFVGCDRPLLRPLTTAHETHGQRGLGYAQLPLPTCNRLANTPLISSFARHWPHLVK